MTDTEKVIKLKVVEDPIVQVPSADLHNVYTAIGIATEALGASVARLRDVSNSIQSVNPNMHPIKFRTKELWQEAVDDTVRLIHGRINEILALENLPDVIKEGLKGKPLEAA